MASKLQYISELAGQTARAVTRDVDGWKRYLTTASRLYKYTFDEQLLIFAQRPDATACAGMELWNDTMHRWVKAGSKGIALIRQRDGERPHLEYVFDLADTRPVRGARMPWLWELREEHQENVLSALEHRYGPTQGADFGERLMDAAALAVQEVYRDHLRELAYDTGGSFLEELDDLNLEVRYRNLLTASVQYALLSRCGLDPADYLEDEDLLGITEFSTPAALYHLGNAASQVSVNLLVEIGQTIKRYEREKARQGKENLQKPLANSEPIRYTEDTERFNTLNRESTERSDPHEGTDLQTSGRLPDSRPDAGRRGGTGGDAPGQVWDAPGNLPSGAAQGDLHLDAADGQVTAPPAGDRPAGPGTGGQHGRTDDGAEGRGRGTESQRPDGLGTGGEQLHSTGGGIGAGGDRLQVKEEEPAAGEQPAAFASPELAYEQFRLFPTVEEQVERIAEAQKRPASVQTAAPVPPVPEAVVGRALTSGGNRQHSRERIVAFFQKNPTGSAAASFLAQEYGTGGKGLKIGGQEYALWFDKAGLHIAPGRTVNVPGTTVVPWVNAAALVARLLREGMFASQEVIGRARENEYQELAADLWFLRQEFSDEAKEKGFLPTIDALYGGFPDSTAEIEKRLKELPSRQDILRELSVFTDAYEKDHSLLRFRPSTSPKKLLEQVDNLFLPPEQFTAVQDFAPAAGNFVTQDEIDHTLCRGSGVSEGKLRIYSYFMQGHDPKECVAFLKNEYGIGGHSSLGYDEWHDGKGIKISRADDVSYPKDYDTVHLNWNQVQKRIRELMGAGRYLNEQEKAYLPEYEKIQIARSVYAFNYYNPNEPGRTYPHQWDFSGAKEIRPLLDDPAQVDDLFNRMLSDFAPLSPDTPHYDVMQRAIRDLAAYQRGEYSLFTPLSESELQAERAQKQAAKEKKAASQPPKEPEGELAKAARALSKKQRPRANETPDGQLTFDFATMQKEEPQPEPPVTVVPEQPARSFDLGYGHLGNGLTVWNRLEEEHGDYKTLAYIAPDRTVTFYDPDLPDSIREQIQQIAATSELTISATQDAPVFSTPAQPERTEDYRLLSRLAADCEYFLQPGQNVEKHLWAGSVPAQIQKMRELFAALPEKPEWLTTEQIDRYEAQMMGQEQEAPAPDDSKAETSPAKEPAQPDPDSLPEATGAGAAPEPESTETAPAVPSLAPDVEGYLNLKAEHPDKLVGVQVGEYLCFYGRDAEEAAPALGTRILTREIPGLGQTAITGSPHAWPAVLTKLLEHGKSVVLARPGADDYEILKERDAAEYIPLGMELTIDGRRMKVDSVDYAAGTVSLQDLELQGWLPIFRQEPVPYVRTFVEQAQEKEPVQETPPEPPKAPAPEPVEIDGGTLAPPSEPEGVKLRSIVIDLTGRAAQPEQEPERRNFQITDGQLGVGGQKAKFQNNLAAIRTLKQIEAEGRLATPDEQEVLSRYVGWGGLADAFDPAKEKWAKEFAELQELLTPEEYESARSTVLNAHYTSPTVIKAIYEAVGRMDFTPGNILEPACGIGNFFGLVPEKLAGAKLYGVELDSITGRIAGQLYQNAEIAVKGFERTTYPDDFFDLAVGNVPFGKYGVADRKYDRQKLYIHDYFITKMLDQVRPGGVVACVTTKGTLDKQGEQVRQALAQKADLLGAIRLPNNAFAANAGTEVTTDILFFQKRDRLPEKEPSWVHTGQTEDGVPINQYFLDHPEMVLGKMSFWKNMYGNETETACLPIEGAGLSEQLASAIRQIAPPNRELLLSDRQDAQEGQEETIPADPSVRNFSFALSDGRLYFRENSRMTQVTLGATPTQRVKGMIAIRDSARRLIDLQLQNAADGEIAAEQGRLNALYDRFTARYGLLNSEGNRLAFRQDSSYPLLCSLEVLDEEKRLERKADMFTKRTIHNRQPVTSVDTAAEALAVSISEKACVDLGYMASLLGSGDKIPQIVKDLTGVIYKDPATGPFDMEHGDGWARGWQTADEYLSGDVRKKLAAARAAAESHPEFAANAEALEQVQPKDLTAAEISVRIGTPWIAPKYYQQFIFELLHTPDYLQGKDIKVSYSPVTGAWNVTGKSMATLTDTRVRRTYGTKRLNAYEIFEQSLNQRSVQVFDTVEVDGKERRVLNGKETAMAQQRQELIEQAFKDWIWKDPQRRAELCAAYNRIFNSIRPREYNGDHLGLVGMNPEIKLEPHQRNAVARMLYGGNSLLAHCVGAGKTFEMIAAAMESKRLGLSQKSLFVVPNHLTEQWGGDFLTLYPGAKVLVATKQDFEPRNRRKFCARIATGDYDAVVIGHSQFEKIPISAARQEAVIQGQIDEIMDAISEAKAQNEERFTIKQMERTRKSLEAKLERLHSKKKDDTVTFEELGIDRLFVDEAHYYKNLYAFSKMRNVAGIGQTDAQKSSDMLAKCRYLDEITGGRGVTFATGTPISNTMVELYTMMRYLQAELLEERNLTHFDNWAAVFGECVTAIELKPEGTGFRPKTRFARFNNLPELMAMWKEAADIQTADMLKLPVPEAEYITIQTDPSQAQKQMVQALAERADQVRRGGVDPHQDNMLKITSDGRKLALDQRIMNPLLPDDPNSKVNACVENVFKVWEESAGIRGAQLIFSDLSTPKGKSDKEAENGDAGEEPAEDAQAVRLEASVYEDIRKKLIAKGIPAHEIAFIHDAKTEKQKDELFAKVRRGQVRVLLGSTQKMGAGTNAQTRLVASHDLDCPWRPADLEQRAGRIIRRGNLNERVKIFRYVTKGTFDAYNWGLVENKQKFIGQVMTSKSPARSIEDVDATALSYAEVKMLATGDSRIKEKMDLDVQVAKLKMLKAGHMAQVYELEDRVVKYYPQKMQETKLYIDCLSADLPQLAAHPVKEDAFSMTVKGRVYTERKAAGEAIVMACMSMTDPEKPIDLGEYRGFPMQLRLDGTTFKVSMKQHLTYTAELSDDIVGNITRINNALEKIPENLNAHRRHLAELERELADAKAEIAKPFPSEAELTEKSARLTLLNTELNREEHAPAQEKMEAPEPEDGKASIRAALRQFERPAPVAAGAETRREAAL